MGDCLYTPALTAMTLARLSCASSSNCIQGAAKVKDSMGNLPLFLACRRKRVQVGVIKALLRAYPEAAKVKIMGALALHHLLHTGSPSAESAQLLIDANPDAPRTSNAFGNLPLHYLCALSAPHIKTVRVVMGAYPQAVQTKNKRRRNSYQPRTCRLRKGRESR